LSKSDGNFTRPITTAAIEVAKAVSARAFLAYVNAIDDLQGLIAGLQPPTQLVLICQTPEEELVADSLNVQKLVVPDFDLTRMGQIKMATLLAFSQQLLRPNDVFVFVAGGTGHGVDTLVTMRVGEEFELFQTVGQPSLMEHIRRPVFERVLRIALELANEGREGKPVGAIFVIGDHREVFKYSAEGRINPFRGYTEKERNILDESITDTVKEIAKLDGAFILKGNGVIITACATLRPTMAGEQLIQGLGARHASAAGITANTKSIAITLSESTGDVRVWRRGTMITEIERSPHISHDLTPGPNLNRKPRSDD
jgi:DNA integrity scanning protein DisA with diadenylate cyclase activity